MIDDDVTPLGKQREARKGKFSCVKRRVYRQGWTNNSIRLSRERLSRTLFRRCARLVLSIVSRAEVVVSTMGCIHVHYGRLVASAHKKEVVLLLEY